VIEHTSKKQNIIQFEKNCKKLRFKLVITHIKLFLAFPSSEKMHKSKRKLVSAFLKTSSILTPFEVS
jgi:hypothetical protein